MRSEEIKDEKPTTPATIPAVELEEGDDCATKSAWRPFTLPSFRIVRRVAGNKVMI